MNYLKTAIAIVSLLIIQRAHSQAIPFDTAVRRGILANGFTYYIRHNETPKGRVFLYLVNKAGSILEEDDQQGLAHFMEHMNFNGTKHFPKNELVDYLQKSGVRFGSDLNAYTSFDETVYQLPLPTADTAILRNGFQIMRDWAQDATLDSVEIDKERGVVMEEARLGKGAGERMQRQYFPVLLNHSRYAERLPIGREDIISHSPDNSLRRYYADWYRPDLQALVVVGEIDPAETEKLIHQLFADETNPSNEKPRIVYKVTLTGQNQFKAVMDKEMPATELQVVIKTQGHELVTEQDYLASMKTQLFNQMIRARLDELAQFANPPFINAAASINGFLGNLEAFTIDITSKQGLLQESFASVWEAIEKVKRFGFTQMELDRAKQEYISNLEASAKEKDKTHSASFVSEYQRLFLHHEASPGIMWEYNFVKDHITRISVGDINEAIKSYMKNTDRDILLLAPETGVNSLPDSATITGWLNAVERRDLAPYKDEVNNLPLMPAKPVKGKIVSSKQIAALGVTELILSNGIKVYLKPTNFKNDEILFTAFSNGGTSLFRDSDYVTASYANSIIGNLGAGGFSPTQLNKILTGMQVNVSTYMGDRTQGVQGATTAKDLETALQLLYLKLTQPRIDTTLFNNMLVSSKELIANRNTDPGTVFRDTINYVLGNYNYRKSPPSVEKLNHISLSKAYEVYKDRFADASGITFVFAGSFDVDSIKPLLVQYLGSLPALYRKEQAKDLHINIPQGNFVKNVYKGTEDKAMVRLVYSGVYSYNPVNNLQLDALKEVLQIKITEHLREDASEVYSPSVQLSYNKYPSNRYVITVSFGCAPKNVEGLIEMVKKDILALQQAGPEIMDVNKFKAEYKRTHELQLQNNGFWLSYLDNQLKNKEDILNILNDIKLLEKITGPSIKATARRYLSGKNVIRFVLLPEKN